MDAWFYNPSDDDRRLPHTHSPKRTVPESHLSELGVLHWKIDVENWEQDDAFDTIKRNSGYIYSEIITLAPGLIENFDEKTDRFFDEHLHPYDESRVILDGSGYWDIRDYNEEWIRFAVAKGDMISLPPGMYHRFTLDTNNYIKALLLYKETPSRIDLLRPDADKVAARKEYVRTVLNNPNSLYRTNPPTHP